MYLLHPDRNTDYVAASAVRQSASEGSLNIGALGAYVLRDISFGIKNAGVVSKRMYRKIVDKITNIDGIDEDWLLKLGRMYTPDDALIFRGVVVNREATAWHPVIAPKGHVDRFEAAIQFALVLGGGLVTKLLLDAGIGSFVGGQYASWSTRKYREDVLDALAEIDVSETHASAALHNTNIQWVLDFVKATADGVGDNNPYAMKAIVSQYEHKLLQS